MHATATHTFKTQWSDALITWLRRDGWVMTLYIIATLAMTYPIVFKLSGNWIASYDDDTYMKLWDGWWFSQIIHSGLPLSFTRTLFFPIGLDLTFHSISWTVSAMIWLLTPLLGSISAYNFSILLAIFTTAYGGYLLIRPMVNHRAAAWLGGAVYSFIPYHVAHSGAHPDLVYLAVIPIALLLFFRAFSSYSWRSAAGAALMLGLAAFTSLYIMIFAFITLIPIFIYLALEKYRWREVKFWKTAIVFGFVCALVVGLRIFPIFQSARALSTAIEQKYDADVRQTDLLSFVIPSRFNPIFAPYVTGISEQFTMNYKWPAYLGLIPLALCLGAITWKERRRLTLLWIAIGLIFVMLSLGPALRLNGKVYDNIPLPAAWLAWFPPIRAVRPDYFVLGLALPLAVCASLGMDRALNALRGHPRAKVVFVVAIGSLLLFEYWNGPFPGVGAAVSPFYAQLANEPDSFALIDLPMGRQESKTYLYLQTIHQHPIVEGLSGRTPPASYDYINANPLLARLSNERHLDCQEFGNSAIKQALDQLAADGFKYVIVHHADNSLSRKFAGYLTAAPVYADSSITVFSIADLHSNPPCPSTP